MLRKQILQLGNKKCFCHGVQNIFASRTQILRPKHMLPSLATPGNITKNIVSATMFPSLARPLYIIMPFFCSCLVDKSDHIKLDVLKVMIKTNDKNPRRFDLPGVIFKRELKM